MKIVKTQIDSKKEVKEFPGLIKGEFEYKIESVRSSPEWSGPRISPGAWAQVLAFFKWTYDTMQSESQVRGYVNARENKWGFWAFPQKAKTGMTATELGTPESLEQAKERCLYWESVPSDDWVYAATIHHHCSGSAFQSGTDELNEKHQFGLHITVGNLNSKHYDLHCRFTLNSCQFEPDMSKFWDIGEARSLLPARFHSEAAAYQMGIPTTIDFPDKWKENVIEEKVKVYEPAPGFHGAGSTTYSYGGYYGKSLQERAEMALERICQSFESRKLMNDSDTMWGFFEAWGDDAGMSAWRILKDLNVDPEDICRYALPAYELAESLADEKAPKQIRDKPDSKVDKDKELEADRQKVIKAMRKQQKGNGSIHSLSDEELMRRAYGCE